MRQKVFFKPDTDSWVEYYFENDFLNIDCKINRDSGEDGASLFLYDTEGRNLCLGTLTKKGGCSSLSKSYPVSYLHFQEIDCENIKGFEVKKGEKIILSSFEQDTEFCVTSANEDEDPAVMRAKNLLSEFGGKDYSREAGEYVSIVMNKLKKYPIKNISPIDDYTWYTIDDIKETFQLTSVEHLIFCENFVRLFVGTGEWYFGVGEETGMFALGIESGSDSVNPFSNASDCSRFISCDNKGYWVVGIGLFSDGQYFCRI